MLLRAAVTGRLAFFCRIACQQTMSDKRNEFPLREGLGVLIGILGLEWLIYGFVHPLPAVALSKDRKFNRIP